MDPRPRPHAQPRRPSVRPVHDQAADAVLDVRARGVAPRPHDLPGDPGPGVGKGDTGAARSDRDPVRTRLFRFPTTGERNRNYDGLGGQILFAWLHRNGVLRWRDNTLSLDWPRVYDSVSELCGEVERLYNEGIDRSRMGHWMVAHTFVSGLVPPNPASVWAQGAQALPTELLASGGRRGPARRVPAERLL